MGIKDASKDANIRYTSIKDAFIRNVKGQRVAIVVPIFILMIGLGIINWLFPASEASTATSSPIALETVPSDATAQPLGETPALLGLATPWGVAGLDNAPLSSPTSSLPIEAAATPLPLPELPADAAIQLLGPPGESRFQLDDDISFYWNWPLSLEENQRFAVYLRIGGNEWFLGAVEQNNLGSLFRLQANPAELVADPAQYEWLVRLEIVSETGDSTGQVLAESPVRLLLLTGS